MKSIPKMRRWIGDKVVQNLAAGNYYKANEDFESTIAVKRNDIEDDNLGIVHAQTTMVGEAAVLLYPRLINDLKNKGFTATGIDGQYFYDTDHPVGQASVSNKGTAALSAANLAAVKASYGAAREAIMGFKDEDGESLGLIPDTLEVPAALEAVAKIICESDKLQDNSPNPYKGTAKVIVNPMLTSGTAWMLHVTSRQAIKPFVLQERKAPVLVSQTNMDSDDVFMRGEYKFGAEARMTAFYGFWQLSYGSTGAGA